MRQKVHSVGSSLTAFSTARFLQHRFLLISHLHRHKAFLNAVIQVKSAACAEVFVQGCEQCTTAKNWIVEKLHLALQLLAVISTHTRAKESI